jgi:PKD repeat protein
VLSVSDGCFADTVSTVVYTFPQPRLAFTNPTYQCAGQGMLFTNTSLDPISCVWLFDDGASSVATNPVHAFANAGLHTVTLIAKSLQNGCPDTLSQQVLIRANPLITPTVSNTDGCGPLLVRFTTAGAPTGFDYYYTWDFGDGGTTVDTAHVAIAQSVTHLYAKRDTITRFEVGLTVFDQYQCKSDTLYSPIVLYPTPTAEFFYTISPVCGVNAVASFTNLSTSTAGNLRYVWDFGDSRTSTDDSPTHEYISSSGKIITLTATNTYTCADSVQHRLEYCDALYLPSAFSPETGLGEVRLFGAKGIGVKQYTLSVYSRFGNLIWTTDKLEQGLPVERWDGLFNGVIVPEDMYIWKCEAIFENGDIWQGQEDSAGVRQRVGTVTVLR